MQRWHLMTISTFLREPVAKPGARSPRLQQGMYAARQLAHAVCDTHPGHIEP